MDDDGVGDANLLRIREVDSVADDARVLSRVEVIRGDPELDVDDYTAGDEKIERENGVEFQIKYIELQQTALHACTIRPNVVETIIAVRQWLGPNAPSYYSYTQRMKSSP